MNQTLLSGKESCSELHALGLLAAGRDGDDDERLVGPGLRVGPYVLLERLGRGGMGHVYKAEHRLMKRLVALKIVQRGRDSTAVLRFRREAAAAGRLRHPNIVTAYDAGESRGRLYLAMEYVEGIDLERLVSETGPLPADLACEIVRQTAEALHHAHQCGLVHRDIKPSNLMLAPPGVTVKLLDLGLARLTDKPLSAVETGEEEELCGTPDFMAPEAGRDGRWTDVRGDLYSLGCTFYYLLSGQVPYPGGTWTEKLLRHSLDAPAPLRDLRPDAPNEVVVVVERLMAREPEDRYPTAAAVASALRSPLSALRSSEGAEAVKIPERRTPRRTRFSFVVLVAILLGVAAAGGARRIVNNPSVPPTTRIETNVSPFQIEGRPSGFASLSQAIAAARDGDVVIVAGPGPFRSPPLSWQGKALTLRARQGERPSLEMEPTGDPWQALLHTDRALTLEGLNLSVAADRRKGSRPPIASLIRCEAAPLHLTDCRLRTGADGAAIVVRDAVEVMLRGCRIDADFLGLSVEVGVKAECRIRVVDSRLTVREPSGAALSLWSLESRRSTPVELELRGNTIRAGNMAALRTLPASLTISARDNRFTFGTALLSYRGYADRAAGRRNTVWQGKGNAYEGPSSWLWVDGRPAPLTEQTPMR